SPMSCRVSLCTTRTTSEIYALSLHDALPICPRARLGLAGEHADGLAVEVDHDVAELRRLGVAPAEVVEALPVDLVDRGGQLQVRSEEHTSELQSRENLVCRLPLEKKNNRNTS